MKSWNIEIYLLDEAGNEKTANCFTKAVYNLHPSFANPIQSVLMAVSNKTLDANRFSNSIYLSTISMRE